MIVLDTNVVFEPLKPQPAPAVLARLDRQAVETLSLTAVNVAEMLDGVERLPDGQRKAALGVALRERVLPLFEGRILAFDRVAAESFARLHARARAPGRGVSLADAHIASIAPARGYQVATRDTAPFQALEVGTIDPWAVGSPQAVGRATPTPVSARTCLRPRGVEGSTTCSQPSTGRRPIGAGRWAGDFGGGS
jgi:predicted nucleic acid-binding protein